MNNKKIYLDYAATTPVHPDVIKEVLPYFSEKFGNPGSIHSFGIEANFAIENARINIAQFLNCKTSEIVFTSGATESNNLALQGVVNNYKKNNPSIIPHIITTSIEHHAILEVCKNIGADVTILPVNPSGEINLDDLKNAFKNNTILVSIMYVNNEIGSVNPLKEIGLIIKKENKMRDGEKQKTKILFHTDATQSIGYFDCNVEELNIDLLSFSGHKIYSFKGTGVLYIRKNTPISRIQNGGSQESFMRAGTQNVPGIVAIGKAITLLKNNDLKKLYSLRIKLLADLMEIPGTKHNGSGQSLSAPHVINICFTSVKMPNELLLQLDFAGIAASGGSACYAKTLMPSYVLTSLGLSEREVARSVRFTLGSLTTEEEIDEAVIRIKKIIQKLS